MKNNKITLNTYTARSTIPLIFFAILAVLVFVVLLDIFLRSPRADDFGLGSYSSVGSQLTTADGSPFDISGIDRLPADENGDKVILFTVPASAGNLSQELVFRSKNCLVTVLEDGSVLYKTSESFSPFSMKSVGTRWNYVDLGGSSAGSTVEIHVRQLYSDGRAKVDNFYFGDGSAITISLIHSQLFSCFISVITMFIGILQMIACLILNANQQQKNYSLLWLSVFALAASFWCLLETNIMQLLWPDLRIIQMLDNMLFFIGGIPLYLYMDSMFGAFRSKLVKILCIADTAYVAAAIVLFLLGILDFHQTLSGATVNYGIQLVLLAIFVIRRGKNQQLMAETPEKIFHWFQLAGLLLLSVGLLGDMLRYAVSDVMDRAYILRICLFLFVMFFGAGNIYHMMVLIQKGKHAELVSQLAYTDGLTSIGNRNAFLEYRAGIEKKHPQHGIALLMLDINNLKQVNDSFGHDAGDEMIVLCAEMLTRIVGRYGTVYRIGGDEFLAVLPGADAGAQCARILDRIASENGQLHKRGEAEYSVSIAFGASFCSDFSKAGISNSMHEADVAMYKKKYEMKREQPAFSEEVLEYHEP